MEPHANITSRQRTWVVALTGIASMMAALDTVVVSTVLSTIRVHLHASVGQLESTVNAYNLSFAVLLMTTAALGDRFGRAMWPVIGIPVLASLVFMRRLQPRGEAAYTSS
jgi:MFS family permease